METGIKSSFIPQTPMAGAARPRRRSDGSFDFLMLVALVLFVASATLAAGVFLYVQFLERSNVSKQEQLQRAQAAFEPALITELQRVDTRMRAADQILENHIAPIVLFQLLEQTTLQTISFSRFEFRTASNGIEIAMDGIAESVNSIALQANLFSRSGMIENPIFADISRQVGGVRFTVSALVRPDSLDYRANLTAPNPQTAPQTPPGELSPFGIPEGGAAATSSTSTGDTTSGAFGDESATESLDAEPDNTQTSL